MGVCIAMFALAAWVEHGSVFTASLVCVYVAYLTIAGMMSQTQCSRIASSNQGIGFSIVAAIFTLAWAGYSAYSSTFQFEACFCSSEDETGEPRIFSLSFFHVMFGGASLYVTMIVSHLGQVEESAAWATDRGDVPRWVNFGACWLVMILYIWTLVGRYTPCLRDRDWD
jgi:hypothetical protein